MTDFLFDLQTAGYEPSIKYATGHITRLEFKVSKCIQKEDAQYFDTVGHIRRPDFASSKSIKLCIQSQQLVQYSLDGDISVETVDIYNEMNEAMALCNKS